jgi:hypothetical protein
MNQKLTRGRSEGYSRYESVPQQGLGLLEVGGAEALGEPAVDRGAQVMRFLVLALLLP